MLGRTNRYSFSFAKVSVWNANLWNDNLGCKCQILSQNIIKNFLRCSIITSEYLYKI